MATSKQDAKSLGKHNGSDNVSPVNYEIGVEAVGGAPEFAKRMPRVSWRGQDSIVSRFWKFVNKTPTCWLWTGKSGGPRHKTISLGHPSTPGSKCWLVHRFSWELHFGPIPDGLVVCHRCDNPICVRPDHLFLDTQQGNVHDALRKGRWNAWGRQRLTAEDVQIIRTQAANGVKIGRAESARSEPSENAASRPGGSIQPRISRTASRAAGALVAAAGAESVLRGGRREDDHLRRSGDSALAVVVAQLSKEGTRRFRRRSVGVSA